MKNWLRFLSCSLLLLLLPLLGFAQIIDMDSAFAQDSFRLGVEAFYSGSLNNAYIHFEQALAHKNDNKLYSFWLAESYYRNGYNSEAIEIWKQLADQGYQFDVLTSRIEQIRRMGIPRKPVLSIDYAISKEIEGHHGEIIDFGAPISICPDPLGGIYSTSYLTGEIIHFDANGMIKPSIRNGVLPFNRIFDLFALDDGTYLATEFGSNRVIRYNSNFSKQLNHFGSSGRGSGQFNGPQYITQDKDGYVYITDAGNCRVSKFTREGEFVLDFGAAKGAFNGFQLPTGVAASEEIILVADQMEKVLYLFDTSGNYLAQMARGSLIAPEAITQISPTEYLIADQKRLLLFNLELETVNVLSDFAGMAKKIVKAGIDLNGNIVVSDFNKNSLLYLTDKSLIYSGLYLQVEHIIKDKFPEVYIDFTVKDSLGRAFCGLNNSNFLLTEDKQPIVEPELVYSDVTSPEVSLALLIDRSPDVGKAKNTMKEALKTIFSDLLKGDYFTLISEEQQPIKKNELWLRKKKDLNQLKGFFKDVINASADETDSGRFDLGIRESVNRLLNRRGKKAIVYLTDGNLNDDDFKDYNLTRLSHYLKNNEVVFYYIQLLPKKGTGLEDLEYLAKQSGGKGLSIFSPTGIKELIPDIRKSRNGRYLLKYHSPTEGGYGRKYIEFSIELTHFNRTGRTVFGYFSPLEF